MFFCCCCYSWILCSSYVLSLRNRNITSIEICISSFVYFGFPESQNNYSITKMCPSSELFDRQILISVVASGFSRFSVVVFLSCMFYFVCPHFFLPRTRSIVIYHNWFNVHFDFMLRKMIHSSARMLNFTFIVFPTIFGGKRTR